MSAMRYKHRLIWQTQSRLWKSTSIFYVFSCYLTNPFKRQYLNGKVEFKFRESALVDIMSPCIFRSTQPKLHDREKASYKCKRLGEETSATY